MFFLPFYDKIKKKGRDFMLRRYELTDYEWEQIKDLLPPENTGKRGRPSKNNRIMLNGMIWIARRGLLGVICRNAMVHGKVFIVAFANGWRMAFLIIFFIKS